MDKDIFYISLFMLVVGIGGQLAWYFFGHIPCNPPGGNPYLFAAPCDPSATTASFQEMENITGYMMIFGFILLPAGLFKDGLPSPGFTAKIFIGFILILLVGVGFTGVILSASSTSSTSKLKPDGFITILNGASNPQADTAITFSPRNVTVIIGGPNANNTVEWTNNDAADHTVTSLSGAPASFNQLLPPKGTFIFQFTVPGVYNYHCTLHSWMFGTVVAVMASGTSSSNTTSSSSSSVSSSTSK